MKVISIKGTKREELGSKSAKNLRREGNVPCVIYGGEENIHFYASIASFKELLFSTQAHIVEINLDETSYKTVLRDLQFHPVSDEIEHIDLLQLVSGKAVTIEVPINLIGNSVGVRNGGRLKMNFRKLKVKGTEENLPGTIDVDIAELRIGDTIRVKDILTGGYEIQNEDFLAVATVQTTRNVVAGDEDEATSEEETPAES